MDLANIESTEQRFPLVHPGTGESVGLNITLKPDDHPDVEKVRRRNINKRLAARNNRVTVEQAESSQLAILVAAISDWDWDEGASFNGEQMECNEANARKLLAIKTWRDQVDERLGDEAAFFQNSK